MASKLLWERVPHKQMYTASFEGVFVGAITYSITPGGGRKFTPHIPTEETRVFNSLVDAQKYVEDWAKDPLPPPPPPPKAEVVDSSTYLPIAQEFKLIPLRVCEGSYDKEFVPCLVAIPEPIKKGKKYLIQKLTENKYILEIDLKDIINEYNSDKE